MATNKIKPTYSKVLPNQHRRKNFQKGKRRTPAAIPTRSKKNGTKDKIKIVKAPHLLTQLSTRLYILLLSAIPRPL